MFKKTILARYNIELIKELAGIGRNEHWGYDPSPEGEYREIEFDISKREAVEHAESIHDAIELSRAKKTKLEELATLRKEKELLGPSGIILDKDTQARLTGAAVLLILDESRESISWEVTRGVFQTFPRNTVLGLAVQAGSHIQDNCFEVVKQKTAEIMALTEVSKVISYDLNTGWPV